MRRSYDIWRDNTLLSNDFEKYLFLIFLIFSPKIGNFQLNPFLLSPLDIKNRKIIIQKSLVRYIKLHLRNRK